jgi:hypothetical protein
MWIAIFATWFIAANTSGYQTSMITYVLFTFILMSSYADTSDMASPQKGTTEPEMTDADT